MLRLNPEVNARPCDFTGRSIGGAFLMPRASIDGQGANGPIGTYESTPAANPYHTDLGIEAGVQPETNLHHIQDKCSSGLRISGFRSDDLGSPSSKTDSPKRCGRTCGRPPSVQELHLLQNDDLEARCVPFEPRTPSKGGMLLLHPRFGRFT
jgi:hypothetical protein